jgi:hypothetical protein
MMLRVCLAEGSYFINPSCKLPGNGSTVQMSLSNHIMRNNEDKYSIKEEEGKGGPEC